MDEEKDTKYREKIIDSEGDEPKTQVYRRGGKESKIDER
jgi:hypothetical protein